MDLAMWALADDFLGGFVADVRRQYVTMQSLDKGVAVPGVADPRGLSENTTVLRRSTGVAPKRRSMTRSPLSTRSVDPFTADHNCQRAGL